MITESLTKTRLNCMKVLKEIKDNDQIFSYWTHDGKYIIYQSKKWKEAHNQKFKELEKKKIIGINSSIR